MSKLPIIAVTMGDATGIGPEVVVKALSDARLTNCHPVIIGDPQTLREATGNSSPLSIELIGDIPDQPSLPGVIQVLDPYGKNLSGLEPGCPCAQSGAAALTYIETAAKLALAGKITAMTTAPISKHAIQAAGSEFPGHTEFLAYLTKSNNYAMMLAGGSLRVALATIHIGLATVAGALRTDNILKVIRLLWAELPALGAGQQRIAVAALNPHAGEDGIFGGEEEEKIVPAVKKAQAEGIDVSGPYPADSLFWRAAEGEFDAVVAMYHDQGLVPLKLLAFHTGVNVTLGLPIIRTSPDHGCAFDLAGKNKANPSSMIEAINLALRMVEYKESFTP